MFEKERNWIKNFHRSETPAEPQATPVTRTVEQPSPYAAQWPAPLDPNLPPELRARQTVLIGTIPTPWQVFAADAETPMPNREIPLEEYKHSAEDMYVQVHAERNAVEATDRLYNPKLGGRDYRAEFVEAMKASNEWHAIAYKAQQQQKQASYSATTGSGAVSVNWGDSTGPGSTVSISANFQSISVPRSELLDLISILQGIVGGKSKSTGRPAMDPTSAWYLATRQAGGWEKNT